MFDRCYRYASWFLTGESRNYKADKGIFDSLSPYKPFSLTGGGLRTWGLAARYGDIDLKDDALAGGRPLHGQLHPRPIFERLTCLNSLQGAILLRGYIHKDMVLHSVANGFLDPDLAHPRLDSSSQVLGCPQQQSGDPTIGQDRLRHALVLGTRWLASGREELQGRVP